MGVLRHGIKMDVWLEIINASMSYDNDKFTLQVVDFNNDEGFHKPFLIHELTKTIKMSGKNILLFYVYKFFFHLFFKFLLQKQLKQLFLLFLASITSQTKNENRI